MLRSALILMFVFSLFTHLQAQEPEKNKYQEEALIVPDTYDPAKKWPLMIVYQEMVDDAQLKGTPYFAAYGGSPGLILAGAHKFNFDPYRIYATAFSRSGHGLLETAWKFPHRFAAIAPICNDLRNKSRYSEEGQKNLNVQYLQQTPVHLIHGNHDSFVKTGKYLFDLMTEHNCPVKWSTFPGGHSPYGVYYRDMKPVLSFFDTHTLNPWPKEVTHVVYTKDATRAFWVDSKMGELGSKQKAFPAWKIKLKADNIIEVLRADESVKALIFHLNDKTVDMKKEVQVVWNDKVLYKGPAKPVLEVKINEGAGKVGKAVIPLWEQLKTFYETPQESGSYDWTYFMMNTAFKDNRNDNTVPRRIFLDLGFRKKGDPQTAIISPESKRFVPWDVMQDSSSLTQDTAGLKRKLPVHIQTFAKKFSLKGIVDAPETVSALADPDAAKSGEVILVKVRMENKGKDDIDVTSRINRTVFKRYNNKVFPKSGDGKNFYYGIWEIAGSKQIQWQWLKHKNEAYQVFAFVMLNPGDLPEAKQLFTEGCQYNDGFNGAQRDYLLKSGETIEFPVLLMSAHSPDPKAAKPVYPDLGKVIDVLKPSLLKAYKELGAK